MDRFSDAVKAMEEILLTRIKAYEPVYKCVDDVNKRVGVYSPRVRFITSVSDIRNENYLVITPTFVGSNQPQIIVDLDSNYDYVIKNEEMIINTTKDNLRKTLLDCMYTMIEDYIKEITHKK